MADPQIQEQQTIPFAIGPDFKMAPVHANFPEPKADQWVTIESSKAISFEPSPALTTSQPTSWLDSYPFSGTTHLVLNMPAGSIVLIAVVIAAAAVAIAFSRRKK